jgi:hypothetical protein
VRLAARCDGVIDDGGTCDLEDLLTSICRIERSWTGTLGVPRDWCGAVRLDRASGLAGSSSTSAKPLDGARRVRRELRLRESAGGRVPGARRQHLRCAPGRPLCLYHEESAQDDFLVLSGACVLLVNGEERPLRAGRRR